MSAPESAATPDTADRVVSEKIKVFSQDGSSLTYLVQCASPLDHLMACRQDSGSSGTDHTGLRIYEGAHVLAAFLASPKTGGVLIAGHSVAEIGCGCGLCGLSAARFAGRVLFSDQSHLCTRNVCASIQRNFGVEVVVGGPWVRCSPSCEVSVVNLSCQTLPEQAAPIADKYGWFQFVVGSELMYYRCDAESIVRCAAALLAPGEGAAIILCHALRIQGVHSSLTTAARKANLHTFSIPIESVLPKDVVWKRGWGGVEMVLLARCSEYSVPGVGPLPPYEDSPSSEPLLE